MSYLSGKDLRQIMSSDVNLALFRIDEKIREKIREFGFTSSIDVNADISVHAADEVQKILKSRGFRVNVNPSVFREGRCTLDVRWLGAGCPTADPYDGGL